MHVLLAACKDYYLLVTACVFMYLYAATESEGVSSSGTAGSLVNIGAIAVGSAFAAFVILVLLIVLAIVIVFICIIMRRWVHMQLYYTLCYMHCDTRGKAIWQLYIHMHNHYISHYPTVCYHAYILGRFFIWV